MRQGRRRVVPRNSRNNESKHGETQIKLYIFRAYRSFDNSYSCITAVKWGACQVKNTAGKARRCRIHWNNSSRSHPGRRTGLKCSFVKIFQPAYQDPCWKNRDLENRASSPSHMDTTKILQRNQTVVRSRKPGQPGQPGSYEEALVEARRDLGNRG